MSLQLPPALVFGAFALKTIFAGRMHVKVLSKKRHLSAASLHWHRGPQGGWPLL